MNRMSRTLFVLAILVATPAAVAACSSDDDASSTTEVVVAGAPLSISGPQLVGTDDGDVVVGTIANVTDRTIEIIEATSTAGDVEFRSADGSLLSSLKIDPGSNLELTVDGVRFTLVEDTSDNSVDVVLGLDIQDLFEFTADRSSGG